MPETTRSPEDDERPSPLSEGEYATLFDAAPDAMVVCDAAGRIHMVNKVAEDLFGYSRGELVGRPVETLVPEGLRSMHEGLRDGYMQDPVLRSMGGGRELRGLRKDGHSLRVEIGLSPVRTSRGFFISCAIRDASARVLAEEERYHVLVDKAPVGIHESDLQGRLLALNQAGMEMLGFASEYDAAGSTLGQIVTEDDRQRVETLIGEAAAGHAVSFEFGRPEERGRRLLVTNLVPLRDAKGRVMRLMGVTQDVTERRRAEEVLRQSVRRLRRMVASLPDGAVYLDGESFHMNGAVEVITGYGSQELTTIEDWFRALYGDHHEEARQLYERGRSHGFPSKIETRIVRKDGEERFLEVAGATFGENEEVWFLHDVTDHKSAEDALVRERDLAKSLIDTAPLIVLMLDCEGRIELMNAYMEQLSGYRLEEVKGKDWFSTFVPRRVRKDVESVFEQARSGVRTSGNVNPILTRDGVERLIEWYDTMLSEGEDGNRSVLAFGLDITDRRRLEAEFLQAQKLEAVGRLAGGIAHDFNNLLMGIIGCARMAEAGLRPSDPARMSLAEVIGAAERGTALSRKILGFSRKHDARQEAVVLNDVIESMDTLLKHLLGEDVRLRLDCKKGLPPVLADPAEIEQILMNLVVNGRDAMPGGGELSIETRAACGHHLEQGYAVEFSVSDTGVGMDAATRSRMFEPFFTTKSKERGTGLGLSTVHGIVSRLGGRIEVESEVGAGTTIHILLAATEAGERPVRRAEVLQVERGRGETVLVVEDEALVRLSVRFYLEKLGYRVMLASNADEAFDLGSREQSGTLDLLLSDIVLPGMSGPDVAARIQTRHPGIKLLFMSAYPGEVLVEQGRLAPGTPSIEKPFSMELLGRRVREALGRTARSRQADRS